MSLLDNRVAQVIHSMIVLSYCPENLRISFCFKKQNLSFMCWDLRNQPISMRINMKLITLNKKSQCLSGQSMNENIRLRQTACDQHCRLQSQSHQGRQEVTQHTTHAARAFLQTVVQRREKRAGVTQHACGWPPSKTSKEGADGPSATAVLLYKPLATKAGFGGLRAKWQQMNRFPLCPQECNEDENTHLTRLPSSKMRSHM